MSDPLGPPSTGSAATEADRLRFQAQLLDSVRESIVATDLEGRVIYWGKGAERLYGHPATGVLGRPITFIVAPADEAAERARMRHVLEHGSWSGQYEQVREDGSRFWADTVISLVHDAAGKPCGFIGIDRDITERRRDLELLRRHAQIIDQIHDSVIATDLEGRVRLWNKGAERIFGYTADEARGMHISMLYTEQDRSRLEAEVLAPLFEHGQHDVELRKRKKGGEICYVHMSLSLLRDERGRPTGMIGYSMDITEQVRERRERERVERMLLQAQKLESLGVLAGGIAHDFNNLLTGILGNAELAATRLPPGSSGHRCLRRIGESAQRAADLCRQMLAYSGRAHFVTMRSDLNALVRDTTPLLQMSISKKAELRFEPADALPVVDIDPVQIRQILMNLVTNASEALGERGGRIVVATGVRHVDRAYLTEAYPSRELPEGDYVTLEVSDEGCGMSPETRARVFDPFFTTKFTGRGLGLAAALGIARGHGGAMSVDSRPGKGSTFRLILPAAEGAVETRDGDAPSRSGWRGSGKVLVVDDERPVREVVAPMLAELGFDVVSAVDGRDGLETFRRLSAEIDLVLLDLTMPRLDGEETLRELSRIRDDVPVVLMSGYTEQDAGTRFGGCCLAGFLQKPFTLDALRDRLRRALEDAGAGPRS